MHRYDLGTHSRKVTTASPEAQAWFDRGLAWCFGYNHDESVACFRKAIAADPGCAMAFWGVAHSSGCNYNKPWEAFDDEDAKRSLAQAFEHARLALDRVGHASETEAALIRALQRRYQSRDVPANEVFRQWNDEYADAMREVHLEFPEDLDVATLFAEAIMNRTPWALWDLGSGDVAEGALTAEAVGVLEGALQREGAYGHPGLLHMYIHLMEMSPHPERALKAADALRTLVPDAGHLCHMPTHIDVLCGHYERVVSSNHAAVLADRKFLDHRGPLNFYSLYRCHNHHFKIYGAMWLGRYRTAIETAEEMISTLPEELLRQESPPMADWLEGFLSVKQHVYVRFGKWREIIDQDLPEDRDLLCMTTATMLYAKAVACAATGRVSEAERHAEMFEEAAGNVPESRTIFNNTCRDILRIAHEMVKGEIEYRKRNHDAAFAHLERAVALDDSLPYDEPWGWMQPTRHALGALLLEQGHVDRAASVYRADLGLDSTLPRALHHPDNVWSLRGYHECLTRLGQDGEAGLVRQRLDLAQARADVAIRSSCFCRQGSA